MPSESRNVYPLLRAIANRLFEEYSEAVRGSIRSIEGTSRGVYNLGQGYVGRMQYAPTLPTEKAIPND